MRFCDESPSISKWANESIRIPYKHPLTGKFTIYVPDFFIAYTDKNGRPHAEVIEKKTGLTFLGDATDDYDAEVPCHMTGKMTKRRVILAKTY